MTYFETTEDVSNQLIIAEALSKYLKKKLNPTPRFFPADFVAEDESCYVEVRCRNCLQHEYQEFLISATKWIELLRLKFDELKPSIFLAVAWVDATGIIEIDYGKAKLVPFKRNKSIGNRVEDIMVAIPISSFRNIGIGLELDKSANWVGR
jgi:hypothetical protein